MDALAPVRRSIPTRYRGIRFRSKLEADWALSFDRLRIAWEYEQEGYYFGGVFYLPDFFLPRSRQYVEVKAIWEPWDLRKAFALCAHLARRPHTGPACPDLPLIACMPGGRFYGISARVDPADFAGGVLDHCRWTSLFRCLDCRGWWFGDRELSWRCQCCGAYRGRRHLADVRDDPLTPFPLLGP